MKSYRTDDELNIGIYTRQSRDDNEKNIETIETQRDLLIAFAAQKKLGRIAAVYMDDNISGSSFDRPGLNRLREDVLKHSIDILLIKDLSRLGRNNSKTLMFLDFLEENGVRVITYDNRYDSLQNDDIAGLDSWVNERFVRDVSRKIRASLRYKIEKGEFVGRAPYGYKKMQGVKNKLEIDPLKAEHVITIFRLYRQGYGYTTIASLMNSKGVPPPSGAFWSGTAIRRILCNRVYTGSTVQGVSEKISFKSKKTRRLPADKWVITDGTHEPIISMEEYLEVQALRAGKKSCAGPPGKDVHLLWGMLYCGKCGSIMYARKRKNGIAYVCGNYFRNGRKACTSHLVYEQELVDEICMELKGLASIPEIGVQAARLAAEDRVGINRELKIKELEKQIARNKRQKEILYNDRLEERIDIQLYEKMSSNINERLAELEHELRRLEGEAVENTGQDWVEAILQDLTTKGIDKFITNEIIRCLVSRITVYDEGDYAGKGFILMEMRYADFSSATS